MYNSPESLCVLTLAGRMENFSEKVNYYSSQIIYIILNFIFSDMQGFRYQAATNILATP